MKIISPLPHKRGRLEIIPLIDIMFFLLAAFMLVSINKIKVDSLKITLPTDVPTTVHETKEDFVSISIDADGQVQVDKEAMTTKDQFLARLQDMYAKNHDQKILISADREAHHGDVMMVLGKIRQAGFQKVAFSIKNEGNNGGGGGGGGGAAAPAAPESAPGTPGASAAPATAPAAPAPETAPAASTPAASAPAATAPAADATPAPAAASAPAAPAPATTPAGQ
jgi:biopolymer transport protein ExbD